MREDSVRRVLLVRACEAEDPEGAELPLKLREEASREAVSAQPGSPEAQLEARSERLAAVLLETHPGLAALERGAWFAPGWAAIALLGFVAGLGIDRLGSQRAVSLLAFPIVALLVWNLAVALAWFVGRVRRGGASAGARRGARELATHWASLRARLAGRGFAMRVAARFAALWLAECGALEAARWRLRLHLGAIAFAAGVVVGLYVAGFAFAYQVTWESTFLEAAQVRAWLALWLGPASALLGSPVPDVASIEALQAPASGPAAIWIHRFALTLLLAVGIPRTLLALRAAWDVRARRAALAVDLSEPYVARVLAIGRGAGQRVRILPYSTELSASAASRLLELAQHLFGNRAVVEMAESIVYGDESAAAGEGSVIVVFGLAQSPEQEVHGCFAADALRAASAGGGRTLIVLDPEAFTAVTDADRVAERTRNWDRVLDAVGLRAVVLSAETDPDTLLSQALEAVTSGEVAR